MHCCSLPVNKSTDTPTVRTTLDKMVCRLISLSVVSLYKSFGCHTILPWRACLKNTFVGRRNFSWISRYVHFCLFFMRQKTGKEEIGGRTDVSLVFHSRRHFTFSHSLSPPHSSPQLYRLFLLKLHLLILHPLLFIFCIGLNYTFLIFSFFHPFSDFFL